MRSLSICLLFASALFSAPLPRSVRVPLVFEKNEDQADKQAAFIGRGSGRTLFLTEKNIVMVNGTIGERISMHLVGSAGPKMVRGEDVLPGRTNYMHGADASTWRSAVPTYGEVRYSQVYPGIDLVFYGHGQELEYDFIVGAHADPSRIQLQFRDGRGRPVPVRMDNQGGLSVGSLHFLKPVLSQELRGRRIPVQGGYQASAGGAVHFVVGPYDHRQRLVIDPVLGFSTYLGGSGNEGAGGSGTVALDGSGNIYLTGTTNSVDFPIVGAEQPSFAGSEDAFVIKLDPTGTQILYSTYLGGSGWDNAEGIAVDNNQNAYIAGDTSSADFPTHGAIQSNLRGPQNAFVTKLDPTGSTLVYSTYLGSTGTDSGVGVAVDSTGEAFVAGQAGAANFPTTPGALRTVFSGGPRPSSSSSTLQARRSFIPLFSEAARGTVL